MAVYHTWKITHLNVIKNHNSLENVIYNVHFQLITKDSDYPNEVVNQKAIDLDISNITNYIPVSELTEEIVLNWVKNTLNQQRDLLKDENGNIILDENGNAKYSEPYFYDRVAEYEKLSESMLQELINPTKVSINLPWNNN